MGVLSEEQLKRVEELHKAFDNKPNHYVCDNEFQFSSDCIVWAAQRAVIRDGSGNCSFDSILKDAKKLENTIGVLYND